MKTPRGTVPLSVGLGLAFGASDAAAGPIHTRPTSDVVVNGAPRELDLDGDGALDFRFSERGDGANQSTFVFGLPAYRTGYGVLDNRVAYSGTTTGGYYYPAALNVAAGARIGDPFAPSLNYAVISNAYALFTQTQSTNPAWNPRPATGFLGVNFTRNGASHFGWIRLTVDATAIRIHDWAFESEAGAAIRAGAGATPVVPEPASWGMLALGAAGVLALRRRDQRARAA